LVLKLGFLSAVIGTVKTCDLAHVRNQTHRIRLPDKGAATDLCLADRASQRARGFEAVNLSSGRAGFGGE